MPVGYCPGLAANIKCCVRKDCKLIQHGRCGGGPDVKYVIDKKWCYPIRRGLCPGGDNYVYVNLAKPHSKPLW